MRVRDKRGVDYRTLAQFRWEIRQFLHFSEQAVRRVGLEPRQHQALLALKGSTTGEGMRIRDLAEHLLVRHHSAVELVSRLQRHGLVRRRQGRVDRRQVIVHATARGERALQLLSLVHLKELRTTGPRLVRSLRRLLE